MKRRDYSGLAFFAEFAFWVLVGILLTALTT